MSKLTPADMFRRDVGNLEGDHFHDDTQKIPTLPYGIALHLPSNKAWADRERVKHGAGRYQDIPKEVCKEKAVELFMANEGILRANVPDYDNMTAKEKYLLLNARYNTGQTYKDLGKALIGGRESKNPHKDGTLSEIYHQTRRTEKDKDGKTPIHTRGMDNRALKELTNSGYYDPHNEQHRKVALQTLPLAVPSLIDSSYPDF